MDNWTPRVGETVYIPATVESVGTECVCVKGPFIGMIIYSHAELLPPPDPAAPTVADVAEAAERKILELIPPPQRPQKGFIKRAVLANARQLRAEREGTDGN